MLNLFIVFLFFSEGSFGQVINKRYLHSNIDTLQLCEFYNNEFQDIDLIQNFKFQCIIALLNYPEFKDVSIRFKYDYIETTMSCKPNTASIFGERIYEITINNDTSFSGPLLVNIPFNAQIGIIAHEFAHIVDYESKDVFGLISTALEYLDENTREKFEKRIDLLTIKYGYGWQLYDWAEYVQKAPDITSNYKYFKAKNYLSGSEIISEMKKMKIYTETLTN